MLHNTRNLIKPEDTKGSIHRKISGYYSSKQDFSRPLTVREWLSKKSFEYQYNYGIDKLKEFGCSFISR